jgi:hypothetical protein
MFNPRNSLHLDRLNRSAQQAVEDIEVFRRSRFRLVQKYVGPQYGERGSDTARPVNMIRQMVDTYTRELSPRKPRALVTSPHEGLRLAATNLGLALDHLFNEIHLGGTLELCVKDAMFWMGITKSGMGFGEPAAVEDEPRGYLYDAGQPWTDRVDPDDFIWDTTAPDWRSVNYIGDRYLTPVDALLNMEGMDLDKIENARQSSAGSMLQRRNDGTDRVDQIARDEGYGEDFEDRIIVWEVFFPQEGIVCAFHEAGTMGSIGSTPFGELLGVREWDGPEWGPYNVLQFCSVPGNNCFPLSPLIQIEDADDLVNMVHRKLGKQAERMKTVFAFEGDGENDAMNIMRAPDGQVIGMDRVNNLEALRWAGPDNQMLGYAIQMRQIASGLGGNLDALAGLGSQSDTARQDALIHQSANGTVESMRQSVMAWTSKIIEGLAWHLHYNPEISVPLIKKVPGTDIAIQSTYEAKDREGDFLQYNFEIAPHSQGDRSPQSRVATILGTLQNVILPLMPSIEQQGGTIRADLLIRELSQLQDEPILDRIVEFSDDVRPEKSGAVADSPRRPPVRVNVNERISRPGVSDRGQENTMSQLLAGGRPNQSEVEQIGG